MGSYLGAVWRCRYFWLALVRMDLRTRYRRSLLGMGWSLLHPIAMTAILCVVFHQVFKVDVVHYGPFLFTGLACWGYVVGATLQGCQSLYQGEAYIRQCPVPLAVYPLRTTLGGTVHFLLALAVVLGLVWALHGFGNLAALPALVPTVLLLFLLCWSLAVLGGFLTVYFQDAQHLCEIGFQLLFYATPIMYEARLLQDGPLAWVLHYNPMVAFLCLVREPVLAGEVPALSTYAAAGLTVLVTTAAAALTLARLERRLIFHL
jgi:ABC-type polysaccharide/polyol phosphate export permease